MNVERVRSGSTFESLEQHGLKDNVFRCEEVQRLGIAIAQREESRRP